MAGRAARGGPLCVGVLIFVQVFFCYGALLRCLDEVHEMLVSYMPLARRQRADLTRAWRVLLVSGLSCC